MAAALELVLGGEGVFGGVRTEGFLTPFSDKTRTLQGGFSAGVGAGGEGAVRDFALSPFSISLGVCCSFYLGF